MQLRHVFQPSGTRRLPHLSLCASPRSLKSIKCKTTWQHLNAEKKSSGIHGSSGPYSCVLGSKNRCLLVTCKNVNRPFFLVILRPRGGGTGISPISFFPTLQPLLPLQPSSPPHQPSFPPPGLKYKSKKNGLSRLNMHIKYMTAVEQ